jgi:PAS domain S-box-containing protein
LVLTLLFLTLWVIHNGVLHSVAQRRISEQEVQRLTLLGRLVGQELSKQFPAALQDSFLVYSLAGENGAARIVLMDRDGAGLVDSQGKAKPGETLTPLGIEPLEWSKVLEGETVFSPPYLDDAGMSVRSVFLTVRDPAGTAQGIARISIEVPQPGQTEEAAVTSLLLRLFGGVTAVAVIYIAVRSFRASQRRSKEELGEAGAMLETFQGLVRQLKEKELELEKLKGEAEQRAAHVESYNENILQSVASGVITFDRDRRITTFNPAAERVLGITRQEALGKTCQEVFVQGSQIDRLLEEALTHGVAITRQEFEIQRPQPRVEPDRAPKPDRIWVGVSTSLLRDRDGRIIGATFVFTDLTEIKHLQEQIELKRRLTVLGEMSAGIAHEFRNFMGTIMGFAKLLSKRLEPKDTRQMMVQAITQEIQAMDRLIEQLLSFGRHTEVNLVPVDLEQFLHKGLLQALSASGGAARSVAEHNRPKLTVEIPPGLPKVEMDEMLMRQAMSNLFLNALEAMPHGGELRVAARVSDQEADRVSGKAGEVIVEISDTGIGIPKDKLDKIFLPFFTTKEKGTGMGLALVHKIILSHNGRIEVESAEGRGTTFRIYLPLRRAGS